MPKISFISEKTIKDCNPELMNKLKNTFTYDELSDLEDEYGQNDVVDAMLAIAAENNTTSYALSEDTITDWLWDAYYEHCHEYVRDAFIKENNNGWKEPALK